MAIASTGSLAGPGAFASNQDARFSFTTVAAAILISLALSAAYYPFENVSLKVQALVALAAGVALMSVPQLPLIPARTYILALLTLLFLGLCYAHSIFHPPVTLYAENKLPYLVYSLAFFLVIAPMPFITGRSDALFVYSIFSFSLIFCIWNLAPATGSANIRYSAVGLSPTMMGKNVLIVAIFAFTVSKKGAFQRLLCMSLAALSVWSSVKTGSRGPILALALSYGVLLLLKGSLKNVVRLVVAALLMLAFVGVALHFMPAEIAQRFDLERLSIENNSDRGDRVFLWNVALAGLQYNWSGYGLGNFSAASFIAAPHNIILEAAYEMGVPLTVLYSFIILAPCIYLKKIASLNEWPLDFFIVLYIMMLVLSLISGEMTLTSAIMYLSGGFLWGRAAMLRRNAASPRSR